MKGLFALFAVVLVSGVVARENVTTRSSAYYASCGSSKSGGYVESHGVQKHSIYDPLSRAEMEHVSAFLNTDSVRHKLFPDIDPPMITSAGDSPKVEPGLAYITQMDVLLPNKDAALYYLEGHGPRPKRYARATLASADRCDLRDLKVGPLGEHMHVEVLTNSHFNVRARDGIEFASAEHVVKEVFYALRPLIDESFGAGRHIALKNDLTEEQLNDMKLPSIDWHLTAPPGLTSEERAERAFFTYTVPGATRLRDLHTVPLNFRIDASSCDYRNWKAYQFFYANQGPFDTPEDLLYAYRHDQLKKYKVPASWVWGPDNYIAHTRENVVPDEPLPFTNLPPPRFYEPAGPRYTIEGHLVKWMGWEFHVSSTQRYGPRVTDVTFRGKRILYEWAMNSVTLIYSCDDPVQGNVFYYDATFGIGETSDPIPTECPETSHYIWDTYWSIGSSGPSYSSRAACVFEAPTGLPKYRQKDGVEVALRETKLVIAFHVPVGNYDYSTVWTFSVLGEMALEYGATGNMQTIFWKYDSALEGEPIGQGPFGDRVSKYSIGCLHDHTFGYKMDFDIWGNRDNTFEVTKFKNGARKLNPLWKPQQDKYLEYPTIRWYERHYAKNELDDYARMSMSIQKPGAFRIVDVNSTNGLGVHPGYEIMYNMGLIHDLATDEDMWADGAHPVRKGGNYRRSHIAITKRKEEEDAVEDPFVLNRANEPSYSLDDYFDGDDIYQEDIVAWVTASFLHHPVAEDFPIMSSMFAGIHIRPVNFFDFNPAIDLPHYYKLNGKVLRDEPEARPCVPPSSTGTPPGDGGSD